MESGRDDRRWRAKEELTKVSRTPVRRGAEHVIKYFRTTEHAFTRIHTQSFAVELSDAAIPSSSGDALLLETSDHNIAGGCDNMIRCSNLDDAALSGKPGVGLSVMHLETTVRTKAVTPSL